MKNMSDIREEFRSMAINVYGVDFAEKLLAEYDSVVGGGYEIFEVEGWKDARYALFHREDGKWGWVFEDPIEGDEHGSVFDTRREAMYAMAKDADDTLIVDPDMGLRIRRAI